MRTLKTLSALATVLVTVGAGRLHAAAGSNDVSEIKALVAAGASLEEQLEGGVTPLHAAASAGHAEAANALVAAGASLEAQINGGYTPLHIAAYNNNARVAHSLLTAGASLEARGANGLTPLHSAARGDRAMLSICCGLWARPSRRKVLMGSHRCTLPQQMVARRRSKI